jgi:hypothetical protein
MIFTCVATILMNISGEQFGIDKRDIKSLMRATNVCSIDKRYSDTPCLKYFSKRESGVYWAICGEKELVDETML